MCASVSSNLMALVDENDIQVPNYLKTEEEEHKKQHCSPREMEVIDQLFNQDANSPNLVINQTNEEMEDILYTESTNAVLHMPPTLTNIDHLLCCNTINESDIEESCDDN